MEIKQRMSKRLGWLLGVVVLVAIGVLVACGSNYDASSDGLMLVGSQGSGLVETFSFNLGTGSTAAVSNTPQDTSNEVCVLGGLPSSLVVDPAGAYAYAIITGNPLCNTTTPPFTSTNGILAFKVNSDGTTTQVGSQLPFNQGQNILIQGATPPNNTENVAVVPGTMVMDPRGKFLFVADRATTDSTGLYVPGAVSVFAIGSGGSVTEVAGSPFFTSTMPTTLAQSGLDIVSVAPTPTVFPPIGINGVQNSVCSNPALNPPTSEYLYAVDGLGNQVFEFAVNTTSGVLTNPGTGGSMPAFATDQTPAGVAVDPCDRFVYVSDSLTDRVSAYTICSVVTPACPLADGSLVPIAGSPFVLSGSANGPGPIVVDPYGNYVYVLNTLSSTINLLKISRVSGGLSALTPPTVGTGSGPRSIAIRADDSWMFVTNFGSTTVGGNTVSQYAITPDTGALSPWPAIQTDNYPWGVAVK
jgi:DNA-binding beta-propeller fold protein YncE